MFPLFSATSADNVKGGIFAANSTSKRFLSRVLRFILLVRECFSPCAVDVINDAVIANRIRSRKKICLNLTPSALRRRRCCIDTISYAVYLIKYSLSDSLISSKCAWLNTARTRAFIRVCVCVMTVYVEYVHLYSQRSDEICRFIRETKRKSIFK